MPGWAAAQNIWYLQDLNAVIIDKLFPDLLTQLFDDWLAEPGPMRRADEVAEFYFVHRCSAAQLGNLLCSKGSPQHLNASARGSLSLCARQYEQ